MHYAGIQYTDIANGEGVRASLFVSGCRNHCKGCHNPETWDFAYGKEFTYETLDSILDRLAQPYISGISILGGEPLDPKNIDAVMMTTYLCKKIHPEKTVWIYSGYTLDQIGMGNPILRYTDVLVDGPYIEEQRDITLPFRGSRNQRLIDVPATLEKGQVVLYENHTC